MFLYVYFVVEPDAALLVEDDEADCGNVIGGRVGWARLLRTYLVFREILKSKPILGCFFEIGSIWSLNYLIFELL